MWHANANFKTLNLNPLVSDCPTYSTIEFGGPGGPEGGSTHLHVGCEVRCSMRNVCISLVLGTLFNVLCVTCCALRVVHCDECVYFIGLVHILLCAISCVLRATCCA